MCMWSIFLVMMRNHTCMTNPNPLLWFPSAADSFPIEYAATFYSLSCLWAYTVLGDWSWQFNSFCTENCEFGYWDHVWCLDMQTLAQSPDSIGERESQFWGALLAHGWEAAVVGSLSWSCSTAPSCSLLCLAPAAPVRNERSSSPPCGVSDRVPLRVPSPGLMKWMDSSSQNHAYKWLSISEVWK